jgi:hypothetical protein
MLARILAIVRPEPLVEPDVPPQPPTPPTVDVLAFAADCSISARVQIDAERLSGLLNGRDVYRLSNALLQGLDDGRLVEVADLDLSRDELLVIQIAGPRGDRERRVRTAAFPIEMQIGPYRVHGYIHVRPGGDALRGFTRREEMVPLTDAWVSYTMAGTSMRQLFGAIAVNRLWVDWLAEATDDEVTLPGPVMPHPSGPLLKDFTGHVLGYQD